MTGVQTCALPIWVIVALGAVFTLARFSEAFLILRARDVGLALGQVPWVLVIMSLCYALFAYPAGAAADRMNHRLLLLAGITALVAADLVLATADSALQVCIGSALWGLHMALTQGLFAKLVADVAPKSLRGTAFGVFNLAAGVALLLASVIAGALWNAHGPELTFWAGAGFALLAGFGVLAIFSMIVSEKYRDIGVMKSLGASSTGIKIGRAHV